MDIANHTLLPNMDLFDYRMEADKLRYLNSALRGITLGNFTYKDKPLKLGDLTGNHFTIILRFVIS